MKDGLGHLKRMQNLENIIVTVEIEGERERQRRAMIKLHEKPQLILVRDHRKNKRQRILQNHDCKSLINILAVLFSLLLQTVREHM